MSSDQTCKDDGRAVSIRFTIHTSPTIPLSVTALRRINDEVQALANKLTAQESEYELKDLLVNKHGILTQSRVEATP